MRRRRRVAQLLQGDPGLAQATDKSGAPVVFYLRSGAARLPEMIALLQRHGADLDARDPNGKTLLDEAIAQGRDEFADVLRRHGAKPS